MRPFALSLYMCTCVLVGSPAATYRVGTLNELSARIQKALPGDEIIVSNGIYTTASPINIDRVGTAANPILIRAESVGGAEIKGSHGFNLNSGAAYVTIEGFKLTHTNSINLKTGAHHCRLSRNVIQLSIPKGGDISYINISGDDMEIDRNELCNKSTLGNMLDVTGANGQVARRLWVHHNYFHDFTNAGGNGAETIRLGLSGLSLSTGNAIVEHNLFIRCRGENEMISNKSSGNTYRYNTVLDSPGAEISQRHGNDCLYYGNYMKNTGGMRVFGDRHKFFSNYFESNSIGLHMGNGDGDVYKGSALTAHDRPDDNIVAFNTFIANKVHYEMGARTRGLGSSNTVVANNLFQGGGTVCLISSTGPYTGTYTNNLQWKITSPGDMPADACKTVDPLLAPDTNGVFHLQSGSPAFDAAIEARDVYGRPVSFEFVTRDMDGQDRTQGTRDIGADEFSNAAVMAHMLTTREVGPLSAEVGPRN